MDDGTTMRKSNTGSIVQELIANLMKPSHSGSDHLTTFSKNLLHLEERDLGLNTKGQVNFSNKQGDGKLKGKQQNPMVIE